jgi:oxygen-independent coproporphyrinogen-3 oxidase
LTKEWIGIGLGASGFENRNLYQNIGSLYKWAKNNNQLSLKDYYFQIIMMGLRMKKGIDLKNKVYKKAYEFYKNKIKYTHIVNNCLTCNNFNLLNLSIIDCL